jgi:Peptidase A4 family
VFPQISRQLKTVRFLFKTAVIGALTLASAAPVALANTTASSNWAGYAVHRSGVKYREVTAVWRQPAARCAAGLPGYSAMWIGLGGFSESSDALEQIGTEVDCSFSGQIKSSAWYELVPAASRLIKLTVRPGDLIAASVKVNGHTVQVSLDDTTRHRSFAKTLHASSVDVSSADWILEAPSDCISATICQTLPLADFGSASFGLSAAVSSTGHKGSISDRAWGATKINLIPGGRRFVANGAASLLGGATTSALTPGGSSFTVSYSAVPVPGSPVMARRASLQAGYLVHPGR